MHGGIWRTSAFRCQRWRWAAGRRTNSLLLLRHHRAQNASRVAAVARIGLADPGREVVRPVRILFESAPAHCRDLFFKAP